MRRFFRFAGWPLTALAFMCALFFSHSCSQPTRQDALQAMSLTYDTVVMPVLLVGIGAEQDAGRLSIDQANMARLAAGALGDLLRSGNVDLDPASVLDIWRQLLPLIFAGIDAQVADGSIGIGVGESLKEAVRLLGERLLQFFQ